MATWGKKERKINRFDPPSTMYYEYSTTVDAYYFKTVYNDDFGLGNETFKNELRFGQDYGRCLMEALICHIKAFESLDDEEFLEKYIKNNRFLNDDEKLELND